MSQTAIAIRTEILGLEIQLADSQLLLTSDGKSLMAPIVLNTDDAERLRMELAKAQLWEWNQLEALKAKSGKAVSVLPRLMAGAVPGGFQRVYRISQLLPATVSVGVVHLHLVDGRA